MLNKTIITLSLVAGVLASPAVSYAKTVCVQQYSGAIECHEEEEKPVLGAHVPVETGLAENLTAASLVTLASSGILFYISKKKKSPLPTS